MLSPVTTAAALKVARSILSTTKTATKSKPTDLDPLFAELTRILQTASHEHLHISVAPRVPNEHNFSSPAGILSTEELVDSIQVPAPSGPSLLSSANLTYGETPPNTIRDLLATILERHNRELPRFTGGFVDAGSGNGTATVCAAQTGLFPTSCGLEYDNARHDTAVRLKTAYDNGNTTSTENVRRTRVDFHCHDMQHDTATTKLFNQASVVFANSVAWDTALCGTMGTVLDQATLQPNALVVSLSRRFPSPSFNLVDMLTLQANDDDYTFYVCRKVVTETGGEELASNPVSDTDIALSFIKQEGAFMEDLVSVSLNSNNSGMLFLAALANSESMTRILLANEDVLPELATRLGFKADLGQRASASVLLRSIADVPIGRRKIAECHELVRAFVSSLEPASQPKLLKNDHVMIRANIVDIIGQVVYDPVGNAILEDCGIDGLLSNELVRAEANGEDWKEVGEACKEAQDMRRSWQTERMSLGGLKYSVLSGNKALSYQKSQ